MTVEEQWLTTESFSVTGSLQELSTLEWDTPVRPLRTCLESLISLPWTLMDASWAFKYVESGLVRLAFVKLRCLDSATVTTPRYELSLHIMTEPGSVSKS